MKGVGGLAAVSMSGASIAEAQEVLGQDVPTDPHTRDTYRSIVDAIVPRTPELGDELGEEHVPGGLEVELEKFLIWDFNHFQEIRFETLQTPIESAGSGGSPLDDLAGPSLDDLAAAGTDGSELVDGRMAPGLFRLDLDTAASGSELAALADVADVDGVAGLDGVVEVVHLDRFGELLDFGAAERIVIDFADAPVPADAEGIAEFDILVETSAEPYHEVVQNYPYANTFPFVFDIVAAEFLLRGENEDEPAPNEQFPGGGTFVRLSRKDRLRCLWTIVDGGATDRLDGVLSPMLPAVGILKFVVMACNGLHGFGYYTEWSGYGDTKTDTPSEREMQVDPGRVQSRTQTGFPGPSDGYAADWRHPVDGGFTDDWDAAEPVGPVDLPEQAAGEAADATGVADGSVDGGEDGRDGGEGADGDGIADTFGGDLP